MTVRVFDGNSFLFRNRQGSSFGGSLCDLVDIDQVDGTRHLLGLEVVGVGWRKIRAIHHPPYPPSSICIVHILGSRQYACRIDIDIFARVSVGKHAIESGKSVISILLAPITYHPFRQAARPRNSQEL